MPNRKKADPLTALAEAVEKSHKLAKELASTQMRVAELAKQVSDHARKRDSEIKKP